VTRHNAMGRLGIVAAIDHFRTRYARDPSASLGSAPPRRSREILARLGAKPALAGTDKPLQQVPSD
jgi:hypothetical protein